MMRPRTDVSLLAAISFIALVAKVVWLNQVEEWISYGHQIGLVVEPILASTVASYIFYIVVVYLKESKTRKAVNPHLLQSSSRIVRECGAIIQLFSKESNVGLDFDDLNLAKLREALSNLSPYDKSPVVTNLKWDKLNWLQAMEQYMRRSQQSINRLLGQIVFLEPDHVRLLTKIDQCGHFTALSSLASFGVHHQGLKNGDLTGWSSEFFNYYLLCKELKSYNDKYLTA